MVRLLSRLDFREKTRPIITTIQYSTQYVLLGKFMGVMYMLYGGKVRVGQRSTENQKGLRSRGSSLKGLGCYLDTEVVLHAVNAV